MKKVNVSKADMLRRRISLFADLKSSSNAFVDSKMLGHFKENYNIIGPGVSEDKEMESAITEGHPFNLHMVQAKPGNGAALHAHPTDEVFMPLSGRWKVFWDNDGAIEEVILGPRDVISVPPGVYRGFENAGEEEAFLLVVLGGKDPGKVSWGPEIIEAAKGMGYTFNDDGTLHGST